MITLFLLCLPLLDSGLDGVAFGSFSVEIVGEAFELVKLTGSRVSSRRVKFGLQRLELVLEFFAFQSGALEEFVVSILQLLGYLFGGLYCQYGHPCRPTRLGGDTWAATLLSNTFWSTVLRLSSASSGLSSRSGLPGCTSTSFGSFFLSVILFEQRLQKG